MDEFGELLREAALADDAALYDKVQRLLDLKPIVDEYKLLWDGMRQALLLQAQVLDPLVDGERANVAYLKEKKDAASIDLISMADKPDQHAHIIKAAQMGLLSARLTQVRAQKGNAAAADALLAFEMPGGVSYELHVEHHS